MKYSTVIMDLDGTITDSKRGIIIALEYSLRKSGLNDIGSMNLESYIGLTLSYIYKELLGNDAEMINRAVEYYRDEFTRTGMTDMKLYSGIEQLIRDMHDNGIRILLASIKPVQFSSEILEHYTLLKYFHGIFGSEPDSGNGSKAHIIEDALKVSKGNAVMIGDRKGDILGAKENNIDSIGVLYGYGSEDEIRRSEPDYIAVIPDDIGKLILG